MTNSYTNPIASLINQRWHNENKDFKIEILPEKISLIVYIRLSDDYFHVLACLTAFSEQGTLIETAMSFEEWFIAAQNRLLEYYDSKKQDWNKIALKAKEHVVVRVSYGSGCSDKNSYAILRGPSLGVQDV